MRCFAKLTALTATVLFLPLFCCAGHLPPSTSAAEPQRERPTSAPPENDGVPVPVTHRRPFFDENLQGVGFRFVDFFAIQGEVRVPRADLQKAYDGMDPGQFEALPAADDPETSIVTIDITYGRTFEFPPGPLEGIRGLISRWILGGQMLVKSSNVEEGNLFVTYNDQAVLLNTAAQAPIARVAAFDWEFKEEGKRVHITAKVKAEDGTTLGFAAAASNEVGRRLVDDPFPFPIRSINDGPGGLHPAILTGCQYDSMTVDVKDFRPGVGETMSFFVGRTTMPGGHTLGRQRRFDLPILEVLDVSTIDGAPTPRILLTRECVVLPTH